MLSSYEKGDLNCSTATQTKNETIAGKSDILAYRMKYMHNLTGGEDGTIMSCIYTKVEEEIDGKIRAGIDCRKGDRTKVDRTKVDRLKDEKILKQEGSDGKHNIMRSPMVEIREENNEINANNSSLPKNSASFQVINSESSYYVNQSNDRYQFYTPTDDAQCEIMGKVREHSIPNGQHQYVGKLPKSLLDSLLDFYTPTEHIQYAQRMSPNTRQYDNGMAKAYDVKSTEYISLNPTIEEIPLKSMDLCKETNTEECEKGRLKTDNDNTKSVEDISFNTTSKIDSLEASRCDKYQVENDVINSLKHVSLNGATEHTFLKAMKCDTEKVKSDNLKSAVHISLDLTSEDYSLDNPYDRELVLSENSIYSNSTAEKSSLHDAYCGRKLVGIDKTPAEHVSSDDIAQDVPRKITECKRDKNKTENIKSTHHTSLNAAAHHISFRTTEYFEEQVKTDDISLNATLKHTSPKTTKCIREIGNKDDIKSKDHFSLNGTSERVAFDKTHRNDERNKTYDIKPATYNSLESTSRLMTQNSCDSKKVECYNTSAQISFNVSDEDTLLSPTECGKDTIKISLDGAAQETLVNTSEVVKEIEKINQMKSAENVDFDATMNHLSLSKSEFDRKQLENNDMLPNIHNSAKIPCHCISLKTIECLQEQAKTDKIKSHEYISLNEGGQQVPLMIAESGKEIAKSAEDRAAENISLITASKDILLNEMECDMKLGKTNDIESPVGTLNETTQEDLLNTSVFRKEKVKSVDHLNEICENIHMHTTESYIGHTHANESAEHISLHVARQHDSLNTTRHDMDQLETEDIEYEIMKCVIKEVRTDNMESKIETSTTGTVSPQHNPYTSRRFRSLSPQNHRCSSLVSIEHVDEITQKGKRKKPKGNSAESKDKAIASGTHLRIHSSKRSRSLSLTKPRKEEEDYNNNPSVHVRLYELAKKKGTIENEKSKTTTDGAEFIDAPLDSSKQNTTHIPDVFTRLYKEAEIKGRRHVERLMRAIEAERSTLQFERSQSPPLVLTKSRGKRSPSKSIPKASKKVQSKRGIESRCSDGLNITLFVDCQNTYGPKGDELIRHNSLNIYSDIQNEPKSIKGSCSRVCQDRENPYHDSSKEKSQSLQRRETNINDEEKSREQHEGQDRHSAQYKIQTDQNGGTASNCSQKDEGQAKEQSEEEERQSSQCSIQNNQNCGTTPNYPQKDEEKLIEQNEEEERESAQCLVQAYNAENASNCAQKEILIISETIEKEGECKEERKHDDKAFAQCAAQAELHVLAQEMQAKEEKNYTLNVDDLAADVESSVAVTPAADKIPGIIVIEKKQNINSKRMQMQLEENKFSLEQRQENELEQCTNMVSTIFPKSTKQGKSNISRITGDSILHHNNNALFHSPASEKRDCISDEEEFIKINSVFLKDHESVETDLIKICLLEIPDFLCCTLKSEAKEQVTDSEPYI